MGPEPASRGCGPTIRFGRARAGPGRRQEPPRDDRLPGTGRRRDRGGPRARPALCPGARPSGGGRRRQRPRGLGRGDRHRRVGGRRGGRGDPARRWQRAGLARFGRHPRGRRGDRPPCPRRLRAARRRGVQRGVAGSCSSPPRRACSASPTRPLRSGQGRGHGPGQRDRHRGQAPRDPGQHGAPLRLLAHGDLHPGGGGGRGAAPGLGVHASHRARAGRARRRLPGQHGLRAHPPQLLGLCGRFARVFVGLGEDWLAPPGSVPTADDVADHLAELAATEPFVVPTSIFDEVAQRCERLGITVCGPRPGTDCRARSGRGAIP